MAQGSSCVPDPNHVETHTVPKATYLTVRGERHASWEPPARAASAFKGKCSQSGTQTWRELMQGMNQEPKCLPKAQRPRCKARCRDGHLCNAPVAKNPNTGKLSTRCRMHGGWSSGPRTREGKAKVCKNLPARKQSRTTRPLWHDHNTDLHQTP